MKTALTVSVAILAVAAVLFAATPGTAHAATLYSDRASWEAAVGTFADVDLAAQVADGETLAAGDSLSLPSGTGLTFDHDLQGVQVPDSWATWSGGNTPRALFTNGQETVTGTFSGRRSAFGLEIEPDSFSFFDVFFTLDDGSLLEQSVDGNGGAAFFGWIDAQVLAFTMECRSCGDFAFGRMVEGQQAVAEPGTLMLLVAGALALRASVLRRRG